MFGFAEKIEVLRSQTLSKVLSGQVPYVSLVATHAHTLEEAPFDLIKAVQQFFKGEISTSKEIAEVKEDKVCELQKTTPQILLLLGDSGSGKTQFCQQLLTQLWQAYQQGQPIPLLINLASLTDPFEQAIEETLLQSGFTKDEIIVLKRDYQFSFIFDGYDELYAFKNLYVGNEVSKWHAKVVITCRSQYLYNTPYAERYFTPYRHQKPQRQLLLLYVIRPLSPTQIDTYIKQYEAKDPQPLPLLTRYQALVSRLELKSLTTNPLLLHLTLKFLSTTGVDPAKLKSEEGKQVAQTKYYDFMLDQWFHYHLKKFKANKCLVDKVPPVTDYWSYCKTLAQVMTEQKVNFLTREELLGQAAVTSVESQVDPWELFFRRDLLSVVIRSSCPFVRLAANQYGFIELSLMHYFENKPLKIVPLLSKPILPQAETKEERRAAKSKPLFFDLQNPLCQMSYVRVPDRISFFADRLRAKNQEAKTFTQADLFQLIEMSKEDERYAIGAANAISVLNQTRVSFSGKNLSRIRIPGADLTGAILDCADLQEADLNGVNLRGAWLTGANLVEADLTDVNFGEYPYLELQEEEPEEEKDTAQTCIFSKNSHWLAVLFNKGTIVKIYETTTGQVECELKGDTERDTVGGGIVFDPKDRYLAIGGYEGVYLWNFGNFGSGDRILTGEFVSHPLGIAFDSEGKFLVSESNNNNIIYLWNVNADESPSVFKGPSDKGFLCVAFDPQGKYIAAGSCDDTVSLWDIHTGNLIANIKGHLNMVTSIAFGNQNKFFASGDEDGTIYLWDKNTQQQAHTLKGHSHMLTCLTFDATGRYLASGAQDHIICLWDTITGQLLNTFEGHTSSICSVAFLQAKRLVSVDQNLILRFWDVPQSSLKSTFNQHKGGISCVAFKKPNEEGECIASAARDNTICLWDVATGKLIHTVEAHKDEVIKDIAFDLQGKRIAFGNHAIHLWDATTGIKQIDVKQFEKEAYHIAWCPSKDQYIATSGVYEDGTLYLWDISEGRLVRTFESCREGFNCIAFDPQGKYLASSGNGENRKHTVCLWDVATGELKRTLATSCSWSSAVYSIAFSPDSKYLVTGGENAIYLWNISNGLLEHTFDKESRAFSVAFDPTGKYMASGHQNGTLCLWDVSLKKNLIEMQGNSTIYSLDWQYTEKEKLLLVTGNGDKSVRCWEVKEIKEENKLKISLRWASHQASLTVENACINQVKGLTPEKYLLLKQRGAVGTPRKTPIHTNANVPAVSCFVKIGREQKDPKEEGVRTIIKHGTQHEQAKLMAKVGNQTHSPHLAAGYSANSKSASANDTKNERARTEHISTVAAELASLNP